MSNVAVSTGTAMSTRYRQLIVPRVGILISSDMPTAHNDGRGFCPPMREHDPTLTVHEVILGMDKYAH